MKIKDFRKPEDYFGNIEPGTVFVVENSVYMAIEPIEEKNLFCLMRSISRPENWRTISMILPFRLSMLNFV